jgi:hypothetical protein
MFMDARTTDFLFLAIVLSVSGFGYLWNHRKILNNPDYPLKNSKFFYILAALLGIAIYCTGGRI